MGQVLAANQQKELIAEEVKSAKEELHHERENRSLVERNLAVAQSQLRELENRMLEYKKEVESVQENFKAQFEVLANKIFEEKSQKFTAQNSEKLGEILLPLKERIDRFQKKVEETYDTELRDKIKLREEIRRLYDLNQQVSLDAKNLTRALKGDTKAQGNWGEFILEKILEQSGLQRDREYEVQVSLTAENGSRNLPDVVVHLPGEKHIIIDSKVSLVAFEEYSSAETDEETIAALKRHLISVKNHIKRLGNKNYQDLYPTKSLDFVLLFIPMEPAFQVALKEDPGLFNEGYDRNIILVGPTTLIATLRTIALAWKHEYQNKNALEIARQGGNLYDKFVGFVDDLDRIGKNIDQTAQAYTDARKKLVDGRGALVSRAEKLRNLGAKTNKRLPESVKLDGDEDED